MLSHILKLAFVGTSSFAVLTGGARPDVPPMFVPYPPPMYVPPRPPPMPEEIVPPAPPKPKYRAVQMRVTACSPEDPHDLTYYNKHGYEGRITRAVAADLRQLPRGTMLSIPGYAGGDWVPVDSAGGGVIRASSRRGIIHIDVKFRTYYSAKKWGSRLMTVYIKED